MNTIQFDQEEIDDLVKRAVSTAEDHVRRGRNGEAEALLRQAVRVNPEYQPALRLLSLLLLNHNKVEEAVTNYEKILELDPKDYEALNNLALCYAAQGEKDKSIEKLTQCLKFHPYEPATFWNLAIQYKEKGNFEKTYETYEEGVRKFPYNAEMKYNYAISLAENFRFEEAITRYKQAIALKPELHSAKFNLSLINLLLGNYKEGWQGYENRFEYAPAFKKFKERFVGKEWSGENEGTVLVYNEQGIGDAIQFARFIPELRKKGLKIIFEVVPELINILSGHADFIVPQRFGKMPSYDYHISVGSLPRVLGEGVRWDGPYLKPTGLAEEAFINYKNYFKIGICWAGNPVHRNDKARSCPLKYFKHLSDAPNVKLFSLQKDTRPRFWAGHGVVDLTEGCEEMSVVDMGDMLIDFNYTAAIMANMDLIVTVDTAVAHLAGAMGLPCHVLLPHMPDWRWGLKDKQTPWYPSLSLNRQKTSGDYESLLKEIAENI